MVLEIGKIRIDKVMSKNPMFEAAPVSKLEANLQLLKTMNIPPESVRNNLSLLTFKKHLLENHYEVLRDCGFRTVPAKLLLNFKENWNQSVYYHKRCGLLPADTNVFENILSRSPFKMSGREPVEGGYLSLGETYKAAFKLYLQQRANISEEKAETVYMNYSLHGKAIGLTERKLQLLTRAWNFPAERILTTTMMLAKVDTIEKFLELESEYGINSRRIVSNCPQVLGVDVDAVEELHELTRTHKIATYAFEYAPKFYAISPSTVREPLSRLTASPKWMQLAKHPAILEFLVILCHIENCHDHLVHTLYSEQFHTYFLNGHVFQNWRMQVIVLENLFRRSQEELSELLRQMPLKEFRNVPVGTLVDNTELLLKEGFTLDDIYQSIHAIFYRR